ncbi:MAG TPA: prolyl oligopeptidase family serine peptidase, partial [Rhodothermales bacterium]|nr:prolyl oligopeptidase family serine peptidase [Rhodothermales bacterium]
AVGVLDALRFPSFTAGPRWAANHGDPADPEAFAWLYAFSPLHRIEDGTCYPATLVAAAANDDLVHPSQSYKFAARLQAAQGCDRLALLRVYPTGGHTLLDSDLEAQADILAFAAHHTGLAVPTR